MRNTELCLQNNFQNINEKMKEKKEIFIQNIRKNKYLMKTHRKQCNSVLTDEYAK